MPNRRRRQLGPKGSRAEPKSKAEVTHNLQRAQQEPVRSRSDPDRPRPALLPENVAHGQRREQKFEKCIRYSDPDQEQPKPMRILAPGRNRTC